MPNLATCSLVCHRRHTAEWTAPRPRSKPCDECCQLVALVLDVAFGRTG